MLGKPDRVELGADRLERLVPDVGLDLLHGQSPPSSGRGPERRDRSGRGRRRAAVGSQDVGLGGAVAGQELLGIAPHAVLVDVEALELLLRARRAGRSSSCRRRTRRRWRRTRTRPRRRCRRPGRRAGGGRRRRTGRPCRRRSCSASAAVVKRPQESVPQIPPMPWPAMAPIGSSTRIRSMATTVQHHEDAGDQADHACRPVLDVGAGRRDRHEAGDRAVAGEADVDRALERSSRR